MAAVYLLRGTCGRHYIGCTDDLTLRLANLDIANALAAMAQGDRKVPIRCVVADLQANAGVLTPKTLVMDTETTRLDGQGQVNLRDETLALRLIASPKTASVLALRGPILLEGKFAQPSVRPDLTNAVVRTGAAVALGAVAGPLAALPFVQAGSASDVDCDPLVTDASRFLKLPSPVANTGPTPRANRSVAAQ